MKLTVVAFGKLKTPGLREAADHYLKHVTGLTGFSRAKNRGLCEVELKPLPVSAKSPEVRLRIQAQEGAQLEGWCRARLSGHRGGFILVDEAGQAEPTRRWASELERWENEEGWNEAIFCVGSSLGFDPKLRKSARKVFSLGPQTLPHELARVVLLEQLYRALSLRAGHPYHNE